MPLGKGAGDAGLRIDVLTIFPASWRASHPGACWAGPEGGDARPARARSPRCTPTTCTAASTTLPSAVAPAWCMKPEPLFDTVEAHAAATPASPARTRGSAFRPALRSGARELDGFSLLCGRYEGVDERVREHLVDGELSIGDYVLTGAKWPRWWFSRPSAAAARGDGQRGRPSPTSRSPTGCWSTPSTPGRRSSAAGRCPTCCAAATTRGSVAGAEPWRCSGPCSERPDLDRGPGRALGSMRPSCSAEFGLDPRERGSPASGGIAQLSSTARALATMICPCTDAGLPARPPSAADGTGAQRATRRVAPRRPR